MEHYLIDPATVPTAVPQAFYPCMVVVQARMGSTRLPGKALMPVLDKPLLVYLLERLQRVRGIEGIVVATTTESKDDAIVACCNTHNVHCLRGSSDDVLSRYEAAIKAFDLEVVVRITADCPLLDPALLEAALQCFRLHYDELDYLSNTGVRTYPRGMDIEIVRAEVLEEAFFRAATAYDKEHVTPYVVREGYRLGNFEQAVDTSQYRLTVDTVEDFELIRTLIERLYPTNPCFGLADLEQLLAAEPRLAQINANVAQR